MSARETYYQAGPRLGNPYVEDPSLVRFLNALLSDAGASASAIEAIQADLTRFGDKCCGEYVSMAANAERFKPQLEQFDQWGRRVDKLHLSEGWKYFKGESAIEGLVSIPYPDNQQQQQHLRLYQAVKLAMFAPSSGMFSCPLAMTDGATYLIRATLADKELKLDEPVRAKLVNAEWRLRSLDPATFYTSGQWFTEKKGGSDLARATETVAVPSTGDHGTHKLYGYKWFTSAVDADVTLTLASISDDKDRAMTDERKPLSLFFLETRQSDAPGEALLENPDPLNGIRVVRLKDKMATRQLPTAELVLDGSNAFLASRPGQGVKQVSPMLHITRFHNSVSAVSFAMRMRNLAVDFAHRRSAFGAPIVDKPLHIQSLYEYDMDVRGNLLLVLEVARLLGKEEAGNASLEDKAILRMITSLSKMFTAKETTRLMSEGVELFGAVGIMENHMSVLFRDATVLPIWEGTTNTLALDLLRVAGREPFAIKALHESLSATAATLASANAPLLQDGIEKVFSYIVLHTDKLEHFEWNARRLSMNLSRLIVATLAARMASMTGHREESMLVEYWMERMHNEYEPMTDPGHMSLYKQSLGPINNSKTDSRGKPRSYL